MFPGMKRWANRVLNSLEFKLRRERLLSYPCVLIIDPTNICNLRCPLCATGAGTSDIPPGMMDMNLYRRVIDELGPYLYELHLFNWGEPFLHRDFFDMVRYAKKFPIYINTSSNFNAVTGEMISQIVDCGLDELTVSIDGVTKEAYEKYRVGGDFDRVMSNLRSLVDEKKRRNSATPEIVFRFLVMKHNVKELDRAREVARELGCRFKKKTIRIDMLDFDSDSVKDKIEERKEWLPDETEFNRYKKRDEKRRKKPGKKRVCKDLWQRVFINWNGAVYPCCNICAQDDLFTTSYDVPFREIWNGRKYTAARRLFREEKVDMDFVCKRCYEAGNYLYVS